MGEPGEYDIQNFLALLEEDQSQAEARVDMDPDTLAAAAFADPGTMPQFTFQALGDGGASGRNAAGINALKRDVDEEDSGSDDDGPACKKSKTGDSKSKSNKADKEKARRCKMNERFHDLAKLLGLGQESKADKSRVLAEAIKHIQQMTVESHQLRQLNKFLEERVAHFERERGSQLYQHSLTVGQQGQSSHMAPPHLQPYPPPSHLSHSGVGCSYEMPCHGHPATGPPHPVSYYPPPYPSHGVSHVPPAYSPYPAPIIPPAPVTQKPELIDPGTPGPSDGRAAPPAGPWLNQMLDSRQDSLLRPPAA